MFSDNLTSWQPEPSAQVLVEAIDLLWERVTVTDPSITTRRFLRTAVTVTP